MLHQFFSSNVSILKDDIFLLRAIKVLILTLYEGSANSQSSMMKCRGICCVFKFWELLHGPHSLSPTIVSNVPAASDSHSFWGFGKQAVWDVTPAWGWSDPVSRLLSAWHAGLEGCRCGGRASCCFHSEEKGCFRLPVSWAFLATPPKAYFVELNLSLPLSLRHVDAFHPEKEQPQRINVYILTAPNLVLPMLRCSELARGWIWGNCCSMQS